MHYLWMTQSMWLTNWPRLAYIMISFNVTYKVKATTGLSFIPILFSQMYCETKKNNKHKNTYFGMLLCCKGKAFKN